MGVSAVPSGIMPLSIMRCQHPLAVRLVAVVELALVLVGVLLGAWCGAWFAPGQNHMNHGFDGLVDFWSRSIRIAWSARSFDR